MPDPSLKISIDASGAVQGAQQASTSFNNIKTQAVALDAALNKTHNSVNTIKNSFKELSTAVAIVDGPLGGVAGRMRSFSTLLGEVSPSMIGVTAAFAAFFLIAFKSLDVFKEYEQAMNKLGSVLEVTGRSSQITAKSIDEMADSMHGLKGGRVEVLDAAAALAEFQNIKTGDMPQILDLANNISTVFGGTLLQNTEKLGRALDQPGQAFGMLARMGVKYTNVQQDALRLMQETGRTAQAQAIEIASLAKVHDVANKSVGTIAESERMLGKAWENSSIELAKNSHLADAYRTVVDGLTWSVTHLKSALEFGTEVISRFDDILIIGLARVGVLDQNVIKLAKDHLYHGDAAKEGMDKLKEGSEQAADSVTGKLTPAIKQNSAALDEGVKHIAAMRLELEKIKNQENGKGYFSNSAVKLKEEFAKINEDKKAEVVDFGLDPADKELAKFEATIRKNQKAFDELGESGKKSADEIRQSFAKLKEKEMTQPITDYEKSAEFNFKKVNEIIVRSGDTFLDALTKPYQAGETAAQRWKGVVASILQDIAREIIKTQIIAKAVSFTSSLFAPSFAGAGSIPASGIPAGGFAGATGIPAASAMGNVFMNGSIIPHANGGVVDRATSFPMAGGNVGTMAENNTPEGILPLKRNSQGQLGVMMAGNSTSGGNVTNNIVVNVDGSSGGSDQQNNDLGKAIATQVDQRIQMQMQKFLIQQTKSGGALSGAIS